MGLTADEALGMSYNAIWERVYGLPAYKSKWMPDQMIVAGTRSGKTQALELAYNPADQTYRFGGGVITRQALETFMADRPLRDKSDSDLWKIMSAQLQPRRPGGDPLGDPLFTQKAAAPGPMNVETFFQVGADGRPEAVTRLVDTPSKGAVRNAGESEMAWLKRRVNEIRWRPTR